ncbi:hypothetical protein [Sodalis glossinidius]|uniref:hypothetical protein n=1 Tax=Sodalis glossinidius TaxID=63612 RepID=UPI0002E70837|nr:hypothetical protein [Sodalis glossinidius]
MATTKQAYSSVKLVSLEKQLAISELWANRVYQFDANGKVVLHYRLGVVSVNQRWPPQPVCSTTR